MQHHARDARTFDVVFIHSTIDDYGLSPNEFRVYCHIARRAGRNNKAWPSVKSMADVCRLSERTVQKAIRRLEELELLTVIKRKTNHGADSSNFYVLLDPKGEGARGAGEGAYNAPPGVQEVRGEGAGGAPGGRQNCDTTTCNTSDLQNPEKHEGTPSKVLHKDKGQAPKEGGLSCGEEDAREALRKEILEGFAAFKRDMGFTKDTPPSDTIEEVFHAGSTIRRGATA